MYIGTEHMDHEYSGRMPAELVTSDKDMTVRVVVGSVHSELVVVVADLAVVVDAGEVAVAVAVGAAVAAAVVVVGAASAEAVGYFGYTYFHNSSCSFHIYLLKNIMKSPIILYYIASPWTKKYNLKNEHFYFFLQSLKNKKPCPQTRKLKKPNSYQPYQ